MTTYCNPLPIPHYQRGRNSLAPGYRGPSFREMADPTVIRWRDRWYLFPSCGMLWESTDLVNWEFHPIEPFDFGYAPTVAQKGDWFYLTASWGDVAIWRARHPRGPWERLGTPGHDADQNPTWLKNHEGQPIRWGDPCLFVDDDGAMYCYCNLARPEDRPGQRWKLRGCDGEIFGVRLDDADLSRMAAAPMRLIAFDPAHTWERLGEFNQRTDEFVLEGAWMNKINGRYYLQYSGNGTQYTNYALGCYVGEHPLGPFTYQPRNPILIHRGGLVNGCAHHSLVEGPGGQFWCFYTILVGIVGGMERRIGMDPAGFDADGNLYIAGPTETPQFAPGTVKDPLHGNSPGWLPLSVNVPVSASSFAPGHEARYAVDHQIRTWWESGETQLPQWLQVDLEQEFEVHAARILFADCGLDYPQGVVPGPYRYRLEGSGDGKNWVTLCDQSGNTEERHIAYDTWPAKPARHVRLQVLDVPPGMRPGVWELTVFGLAVS